MIFNELDSLVWRPTLHLDSGEHYEAFNAGYHEDESFYESLVERFRPSRAIDLGCGTGRITRLLAKKVPEVLGVDRLPHMLEYAALQPTSPAVRYREFDACKVADNSKFNLAVASFSVLNSCLTLGSLLRLLRSCRSLLTEGGHFAFDLVSPFRFLNVSRTPQIGPGTTDYCLPSAENRKFSIRTCRYIEPMSQQFLMALLYDIDDKSAGFYEFLQLRWFYPEELSYLLEQSGFGNIEIFGDFEQNSFVESSPNFVVVAEAL